MLYIRPLLAAPHLLLRKQAAVFKSTAACSSLAAFSSNDVLGQRKRLKSTAVAVEQDTENFRIDYNVSQTLCGTSVCRDLKLESNLGITNPSKIYHNLAYQELFAHEVENNEGTFCKTKYGYTFAVDTGKFTGRSPKDKWIVRNPGSESELNVDWNEVNKPTTPEVFDELYEKAVNYINSLDDIYVFDGFCGASTKSRKKVRFITEMAWQQHFVTNMFIRPESREELATMDDPDFTIINVCSQKNKDWKRNGLNSEVAAVFNIEKKCAVIFGTWYGGENKKGIFSLMNYWLPLANPPQLPMHCSANVGKMGDSALFFGLSGTGKTTLSADPHRYLIGDDEHGWDEDGIYNFEGGCYAKTINLSEENEPDIYRAIRKDALLENVMLETDEKGKLVPNYFNTSKTENGRVSYPIHHIENFFKPQQSLHPENIIFLTCDAFGILPPVSKLSSGQAMYHFLSGYTAKVAGTERGVKEPVATFSACFGAAFLTLCPTRYADLLASKMKKHGSNAFLVNTGWIGGKYGKGNRISIKNTRLCIDAILNGSINKAPFVKDDIFGFDVPKALPGIDSSVLDPRDSWGDKEAYDIAKLDLARMYMKNFEKYSGKGSEDYTQYGPKL